MSSSLNQRPTLRPLKAVTAVRIRSGLHRRTPRIPGGSAHLRDLGSLINWALSPHIVRMILGRGPRRVHRGGDFVEPVEGTTMLGHGVVNAAAALPYAKAHPHPQVAADFAPAWFRWTRLTLLAAVVVKYTWALIQMVRRRWPARPFPQVC